MNRKSILTLIILVANQLVYSGVLPLYKDSNARIEVRVNDLLKRMTLEEKIGQLNMPGLFSVNDSLRYKIQHGNIGSFCVVRFFDLNLNLRNELQQLAVEKSRLGIPMFFAFDVIHGYRTIFPTPLALSATWDTELVKKTAKVAAREAKSDGINMTFSPMVDVSRDARWGRISESSGEDVLLNSVFGRAMVEGYQGERLNDRNSIGACVKHFVGYGAAMGGRDYQFTELSERTLRETYLPPFHECIQSGAVAVMSGFNDISGVPATANAFTLNQILRKEWDFKGFVVSDWNAIAELQKHGVSGSPSESAQKAISSGVDMEMTSTTFTTLPDELKKKHIVQQAIDDAVRRVLKIKFELGLFEKPYVNRDDDSLLHLSSSNRNFARKVAAESMVLLKNEGVLPLKNMSGRYTVLGQWANNQDLMGWWTGKGDRSQVVTVIDGLLRNKPNETSISFMPECQTNTSDTVVVCVGEPGDKFGEDHSSTDLELPWGQQQQIRQLKESGKTVIAVVFNGRPLVLTEVAKYADAILIAWHPGIAAGDALADVLFGKINPAGHLTVSFPKKSGQVPLFYSERISGRPNKKRYSDVDNEPLYPFGFGLSYSKFSFENIKFSKTTFSKNESVTLTLDVKNRGIYDAKEVVQIYIHDQVASTTQPQKKLIDFRKIELKAGESKSISFELKANQFSILDDRFHPVVESGDFDIWVAEDSKDERHHSILKIK